MHHKLLISINDLQDHLSDPEVVLVDTRFDLTNPDWGYQDYLRAHIPGAIFMDLNKDLSSPPSPATGRHPLPESQTFHQRLMASGIHPGFHIIVYDTIGGAYAARLWWLLRYYRFPNISLLDGGFTHWLQAGLPISSGMEQRQPVSFELPEPDTSILVTIQEVQELLGQLDFCLVDSRSPERYRGEIEPIDPIPGHIPGATNRFHGENLNADLSFKTSAELRNEFQSLIKTKPENVVFYCGSGVTSCLQMIAMEHAGLPGSRIYIGSWSEWIRDPSRTIVNQATSSID